MLNLNLLSKLTGHTSEQWRLSFNLRYSSQVTKLINLFFDDVALPKYVLLIRAAREGVEFDAESQSTLEINRTYFRTVASLFQSSLLKPSDNIDQSFFR